MKKISLFTPCYNEEDNVLSLYHEVAGVMATLPQYDYEYVFIDNCSTDRTAEILQELAASDKRVKVILNVKNFGPARSGFHGFMQTDGDASICLACDFQDPPEMIPEFIKKWEAGYKVVWGQKIGSNESRLMYAVRSLYYKIIKLFSDIPQYEQITGFGLYDREVMDLIRAAEDPSPNLRNMVAEFGYDVGLITFRQPLRRAGKSSYNFFRYFTIAMTSLVNTSKVPLRMATFLGFFLAVICFLIGMFYLVLKLTRWYSFDIGMAPLVIGLFFLGAVQLVCIGIIGEYIGEILTRVTKRPMVVEKRRINFEEDGAVAREKAQTKR